MTRPQETTPTEKVVLYAARDAQGRLFLTDDRSLLPPDAEDCRELPLAPTQVTWAMLRVEVEELRGISVTIRVGDYHYATPTRATIPSWEAADTPGSANRDEKGETLWGPVSQKARA